MRLIAGLLRFLAWIVALSCIAWTAGALFFDLPNPLMRVPAAIAFVVLLFFAIARTGGAWTKLFVAFGGCAVMAAWWFQIQPRNDRKWQPDVAQTASAVINADEITFYNVRSCDYRTETDYTPHWDTRRVRLSQLTGIDLAINYWGSPWMAHPIASFQFADAPPLCFSLETRKEVGESYSAIGGLYRQFELICIVAEERDVLRVRTNFRKGEDVYLYRTKVSPARARERLLDYVRTLNQLHERPRWYNAVTTNCTTVIRSQHAAAHRTPWDWRLLVNGKADELLYERGAIATGGLPFAELKKRALINPSARAANAAPDFSRRIRAGRPGM